MPDDDRFRRGLSRLWMRVQRSISAGDHQDRTADLMAKAVADDLRRLGGLGALAKQAEATELRTEGAGWFDTILNEPTVSKRHYLTLLAAARLTQDLALTSPVTAVEALAERLISDIADDRLDRMVPSLIGPGGLTAVQFADLREGLGSNVQMIKLRGQLSRHPDADGLRAPRRRVRPSPVKDLLNTDLSEL